jgi:hypothetical protein
MIESWPEIMLMMEPGTKNGEIFRGPPASTASWVSSMSGNPPMPEPMHTPDLLEVLPREVRPESLDRLEPAARP